MNIIKLSLFVGIFLVFAIITPNAYGAITIDDFSDGADSIVATINCIDADVAASVLGATRNTFACIDSGSGSSTAETDTSQGQFIFTLNQADGSSGLNYDDGGNLLSPVVDLTQGGVNNSLELEIIKADKQTTITVEVSDLNGNIGIFEFNHGPSASIHTETIPFSSIVDPNTLTASDFTIIDHVGVFFEGSEPNAQDTEFVLGSISADFAQVPTDITISKSDNVDPVIAGNFLTYTIRVTNTGTDAASNVIVTDVLPAGVTLSSTSGCVEDPTGVPTCTIGSIPANSFVEYTVTVLVDSAASGTITNTATVSSSNDPDPNNNSASEQTMVNSSDPNDPDNDGIPNSTDPDDDNDGCLDSDDPNPLTFSADQDGDGFGNDCDAAPANACIPDPNVLACTDDEQTIGGEIIPVKHSALLLAGVQSVSVWAIPVIAGIGAVAFLKFRGKL